MTKNFDVPVYAWGSWPENLLTKKQMGAAGFQTGKKLPAPAGMVNRKKSPSGVMWLHDRNQGVPKRSASPAQLEALERARYMAEKVSLECARCKDYLGDVSRKEAEQSPDELCQRCVDAGRAKTAAREILATDFLVLDTETTGLNPGTDAVIELAVIDAAGAAVIDTRLFTDVPISAGAVAVHGITAADLVGCPSFVDVYDRLFAAVCGKTVVIYNVQFDVSMLAGMCDALDLPSAWDWPVTWVCAMELYAQYFGEWSDYWGSYTWQPLPGGDHTALGDCCATLDVMRRMAK